MLDKRIKGRVFTESQHLVWLVENFRAQKGEPIPVKTPNPFTLEVEDTWTPYVTRQSTMMSPVPRSGSKSPTLPYSPRRQRHRDKQSESPDLTIYPATTGIVMSPRYGTGLGGGRGFVNYYVWMWRLETILSLIFMSHLTLHASAWLGFCKLILPFDMDSHLYLLLINNETCSMGLPKHALNLHELMHETFWFSTMLNLLFFCKWMKGC